MSNTPLFEMQDISMQFGATTVRNGVNFSCNFGEIYTVLGENSAGLDGLRKSAVDTPRGLSSVGGLFGTMGGVIIIVMLLFQTLRKGVYL